MDGMIKSTICAGIVTYNPDIARLKENINHVKEQVDSVIVWDNGSANLNQFANWINEQNIVLIASETNRGIAYALNRLCAYAEQHQYQWILTLDQDSICPENLIEECFRYCDDKTAAIGPRILYEGNEEFAIEPIEKIEKVEWIITSGTLTNVNKWRMIGGFDEFFFIDKVDTDFGIRANRAGYFVLRNNDVVLHHELGKLKCIRFLGRTIYVTNHSPQRIYYQCRNQVLMKKKLGYGNVSIEMLKIIIKIIIFEQFKIEKLSQAINGIKDGMRER